MKLRKMKRGLVGFSVIAVMGISLFSAGTDVLPVKAEELEETVTTEDAVTTSEEASAESTTETAATGETVTTAEAATTEEAAAISEETLTGEVLAATSEETATRETAENTTEVAIDETNFPDSVFRNYVMQFDTDGNGSFSSDELLAVTRIDVDNKEIASLEGVEYFTALEELWCIRSRVTSLDVSKNIALKKLYCYQNQLTSLNVSNNPALEKLICDYNQLTSLDVSKNIVLKELKCG